MTYEYHPRYLVREKVAEALDYHIQDIPVFKSGLQAISSSVLPIIIVQIGNETVQNRVQNQAKNYYNREVEILVVIKGKNADAEKAEDQVNKIARRVENALLTPDSIVFDDTNLITNFYLESFDVGIPDEGTVEYIIQITFKATYNDKFLS